MVKARDAYGGNISIGDVVEVVCNPEPYHRWMHEGNRLRVVGIEDRSFQGEGKHIVIFFETMGGGKRLLQGLRADRVRIIKGEK